MANNPHRESSRVIALILITLAYILMGDQARVQHIAMIFPATTYVSFDFLLCGVLFRHTHTHESCVDIWFCCCSSLNSIWSIISAYISHARHVQFTLSHQSLSNFGLAARSLTLALILVIVAVGGVSTPTQTIVVHISYSVCTHTNRNVRDLRSYLYYNFWHTIRSASD